MSVKVGLLVGREWSFPPAFIEEVKSRRADDIVYRITTFEIAYGAFEEHLRRLLRHVRLRAIFWVNIGLHRITFTTIE